MNRDEFSNKVKRLLAGRVGHLCSNPACRQSTIGPGMELDETINIGEAAHITAAAPGGPRFDESITSEERQSAKNGIWLCRNCAAMIDRDVESFTIEMLHVWKSEAEWEQWAKIHGTIGKTKQAPRLDCDLIWTGMLRSPRGTSLRNPIELLDGRPTMVFGVGYKPIIHWEMEWKYNLIICNNSTYPAYNIKVEAVGNIKFDFITIIENVNNLPAHNKRVVLVKSRLIVEGNADDIAPIQNAKVPPHLNGLALKVTCEDEAGKCHNFLAKIVDGRLVTKQA